MSKTPVKEPDNMATIEELKPELENDEGIIDKLLNEIDKLKNNNSKLQNDDAQIKLRKSKVLLRGIRATIE